MHWEAQLKPTSHCFLHLGARENVLQEHFIPQHFIYLLSDQPSHSLGCVKPKVSACPGIATVSELEIQPISPLENGFFSPVGKKQDKKLCVQTPLHQNSASAVIFQVGNSSWSLPYPKHPVALLIKGFSSQGGDANMFLQHLQSLPTH